MSNDLIKVSSLLKIAKKYSSTGIGLLRNALHFYKKNILSKQKTLLELEHHRLNNLKISLQNKQTELESLCQNPNSIKKIEVIAADILKNNFKFVRQLEEVDSRFDILSTNKFGRFRYQQSMLQI